MYYIIYQFLNQSNKNEFYVYCMHKNKKDAFCIFEIIEKMHPEFKVDFFYDKIN